MAAHKRDRSVGRRISDFLLPTSSSSDQKQQLQPSPVLGSDPSNRPVSRGRVADSTSTGFRKPSLPFHPASRPGSSAGTANNSPRSQWPADATLAGAQQPWMMPQHGSSPSLASLQAQQLSAHHSSSNSLEALPIIPPRAPFAQSSSSRPGSRDSSPVARSRESSPKPAFLQPASSSGPLAGESPLQQQTNAPQPSSETKQTKRRTWLPGSKDKGHAHSQSQSQSQGPAFSTGATSGPPGSRVAWIAGHNEKIPYDLSHLINAEPVNELWDDGGDTFIYLFPQSAGHGPSFRLNSNTFTSSALLTQLAFGDVYSSASHSRNVSRSAAPPQIGKIFDSEGDASSTSSSRDTRADDIAPDEIPKQIHLHLPVVTRRGPIATSSASMTKDDIDALLAVRNMFAFLIGQSLIATEWRPTVFMTFLKIGESLVFYNFSNLDGSTFGEMAASSFESYVDELELADVRSSREKTIECLVLGERMRCVGLYNEAFVHAVGKYADIAEVCKVPEAAAKFALISDVTRKRMERASIDLGLREANANTRLGDFYFPSLFAGFLGSKSADERRAVQFNVLKDQFSSTRKHVLSYYKDKYGSWPPKASSKKNNLERSGLNRLVLKELYHDFADLYDLFVDRKTLTARNDNAYQPDSSSSDPEEPASRVLWRVFDEYDRANPPVQPPVPFDLPLLPSTIDPVTSTGDSKKDAKQRQRKLKEDEIARLLHASTNSDTLNAKARSSSFLQSMLHWERKNAKGCSLDELSDRRAGTWIFCYVVLQALPMLVVDAPGVKYTRGVEYFLCEPPRSGVPWANHEASAHGRVSRHWYGLPGGAGVVSLPSDLVEHGVEGIYRRSHCWLRSAQWTAALALDAPDGLPPANAGAFDAFAAPPQSGYAFAGLRNGSSDAFAASASRSGSLAPPSPLLGAVPDASTPRARSMERRRSALASGLETLPLPPDAAASLSSGPSGLGLRGAGGSSASLAGLAGAGSATLDIPRSREASLAGPGLGLSSGAGSSAAGGASARGSVSGAAGAAAPGKSFDAIIADMEAEKAKSGGKGGKKSKK